MKFMIFIVVIILIVVLRKRVIRFFKKNLTLKEVLIPNYGGEGPLWGPMVSPDEANNGCVFYWGRAFRRAAYLSGRDGLTSPMQAFGTLAFVDKRFETKADGAKIVGCKMSTNRNGQTKITWSFDKSPYKYGLTSLSKSSMLDDIQDTFNYYQVDRWPLKVARCTNPDDISRVREINADIRAKGWLASDMQTIRYDVQD